MYFLLRISTASGISWTKSKTKSNKIGALRVILSSERKREGLNSVLASYSLTMV